MPHVDFGIFTMALAAGLFLAMLLLVEIGWRIGFRHRTTRGREAGAGVGVVDNAVYGLFGLLMGFAFNGAAGRFQDRRELIVNEASTMSTAWQRVDLIPEERQDSLRLPFRRYVDAVIAVYASDDFEELAHNRAKSVNAEQDLWRGSIAGCRGVTETNACNLLISAVNQMFDAVELERVARRMHPPNIIYVMLAIAALACALLGGYGLGVADERGWIYVLSLCSIVTITFFVIVELDYPRLGLIRVDSFDLLLREFRTTMH
jgi:hypothetical protein